MTMLLLLSAILRTNGLDIEITIRQKTSNEMSLINFKKISNEISFNSMIRIDGIILTIKLGILSLCKSCKFRNILVQALSIEKIVNGLKQI